MKLVLSALAQFCLVAGVAHWRPSGHVGLAGRDGSDSQQAKQVATQKNTATSYRLELQNHRGVQYTAPVFIGGQPLQAIYDTGSWEIMAISKQCSVCHLSFSQRSYDNASSKTYKKGSHGVEEHLFAGGKAKARQDFESVHVGSSDSVVKADGMPFWQILETNMKVFLNEQANFSAIIGMGHVRKLPSSDSIAFLERAGAQRFSVCLMPGLGNPGYITFNPTHDLAHSAFRKLDVVGEKHWAVRIDQVSTDLFGTPLHSCWVYGGQQDCVAIIDSGTSLIGVPPNAAVMIKTLIKRIRYDCSNLDELPDLVFVLDGKRFALPARAYTVHFGMKDGKPYRCLPAFTDVSMSLKGANVWILGLPFLRYFYTVFDRAGPSIHVANQGEACEPDLAGHVAFLEASTGRGNARQQQALSFADPSQASLPLWARNGQQVQL